MKRPDAHLVRIGVCIVLFFATLVLSFFYVNRIQSLHTDPDTTHVYRYHISMIPSGFNSTFWERVLDGARAEAEKQDAYVELAGQGFSDDMTETELLDMAYYSYTDGIILYPEDSPDVETEINKIVESGIPVITVGKDSQGSHRNGFVGVNDYFLGQTYGRELEKRFSGRGNQLVAVLYPGKNFNAESRSWFMQGLVHTVERDKFSFGNYIVHEEDGLSDAEDLITELLTGDGDARMPDIILCLNSTISDNACSIIADRGLSGTISVIGFNTSEQILQAIRSGDLLFTVVTNPETLGKQAVGEVLRYLQYHVVNFSINVSQEVLDQDNIGQLEDVYKSEEADDEKTALP